METVFVANYPVLDQPAIVIRDRHSPVHILEQHQLDDLIEHVVHYKVVVLLGDLAVVEQGQVEQVMHLELHEASLCLYLLQNVEFLLGRYVCAVHA